MNSNYFSSLDSSILPPVKNVYDSNEMTATILKSPTKESAPVIKSPVSKAPASPVKARSVSPFKPTSPVIKPAVQVASPVQVSKKPASKAEKKPKVNSFNKY